MTLPEVRAAGSSSLDVVPTSGATAPRTVSDCVSDFSWSPTSKLIAFECMTQPDGSGEISTVRPDGTQPTDLLKGRPLTDVPWQQESGPQWAPDGSRLLLLAHGDYKTVDLWSVRPNGRGLTRLG